jgi:hypothetical protein
MNDDRTDLEVFQQCRDLVFGDWTSATIFVPLRVWIGEKLLHHLLGCYLRAVLGKHRPQCCEQLDSYAGAERRIDNDRRSTPNMGRAGLERAQCELSVIESQLRLRGLLE